MKIFGIQVGKLKPIPHRPLSPASPRRWCVYTDSIDALALGEGTEAIGVMVRRNSDGTCEFHQVDPDKGTTLKKLHVPWQTLRQAFVEEIPKCRIAHLSREELHSMGYTEGYR